MQTQTHTDWLADILITPSNTERKASETAEAAGCSGRCSSGLCRTAG